MKMLSNVVIAMCAAFFIIDVMNGSYGFAAVQLALVALNVYTYPRD